MICFCRIAAVRDQGYKITPNRDTANRGARFRMMMRISEKVECRPFHLSPPTRYPLGNGERAVAVRYDPVRGVSEGSERLRSSSGRRFLSRHSLRKRVSNSGKLAIPVNELRDTLFNRRVRLETHIASQVVDVRPSRCHVARLHWQ